MIRTELLPLLTAGLVDSCGCGCGEVKCGGVGVDHPHPRLDTYHNTCVHGVHGVHDSRNHLLIYEILRTTLNGVLLRRIASREPISTLLHHVTEPRRLTSP